MALNLLKKWAGDHVVFRYDQPTGAFMIVAIHSMHLGPAAGGTRMKPYPNTEAALADALRLAEGMTFKFAVCGADMGGGKAVIATPDDLASQDRTDLLRRYGTLIHQLGGAFLTGPDMGTTSEDMDIIAQTGAPYVFGCTPAAGGAGDTGPYTSLGVFAAMQTICAHLSGHPSLSGRRVLIQGAGKVGAHSAERLHAAGAKLYVCDVDAEALHDLAARLPIQIVEPVAAYGTPCDIFAPCAVGGTLNASTIPQLKCKAVVGAANNQLAAVEDAERLASRRIIYAPDYVVNAGAAFGIPGIEAKGWSPQGAEERIVQSIQQSLTEILELANDQGLNTAAAARRMAERRLATDPAVGTGPPA